MKNFLEHFLEAIAISVWVATGITLIVMLVIHNSCSWKQIVLNLGLFFIVTYMFDKKVVG